MSSERTRGPDVSSSAEYNALLIQYGEAMARIGQLEAEVEALSRRLEEGGATRDTEDASDPAAAEDQTTRDSEDEGPPDERPQPATKRAEDLSQFRLQVASLANELARAEGELNEVRGQRAKRRGRRGENRPGWMFWRRRRR